MQTSEPRYFVWTESFIVKAFEIDTDGRALLSVLANYMQEAAGSHAARLGFAMEKLFEQGQGWVLNRFTIQVTRYPKSGEMIRIETWPSAADRLFGYRDFDLYDESGGHILSARTAWLIIDIEKRRPLSTPEVVKKVGGENTRFAAVEALKRMPRIESGPDATVRFRVCRADLDINQHVNNVRYLEWILEVLGRGTGVARPSYVDIQFKAESSYGDVAIAEKHPQIDEGVPYRILRESDQKELAIAVLRD